MVATATRFRAGLYHWESESLAASPSHADHLILDSEWRRGEMGADHGAEAPLSIGLTIVLSIGLTIVPTPGSQSQA
jgi:hypothetical protein